MSKKQKEEVGKLKAESLCNTCGNNIRMEGSNFDYEEDKPEEKRVKDACLVIREDYTRLDCVESCSHYNARD